MELGQGLSKITLRPPNKQLVETYLHIARPWSRSSYILTSASMICVINRLLNDCCFLEHRYHDTIRRANSTSLSADRSPRQLSKAKKSGSSLLAFLKTACLRAFKRVWLVRKSVSTISPLRKCGGYLQPQAASNM